MSGKHLALKKAHVREGVQQLVVILDDQMGTGLGLDGGMKLSGPDEKNVPLLECVGFALDFKDGMIRRGTYDLAEIVPVSGEAGGRIFLGSIDTVIVIEMGIFIKK